MGLDDLTADQVIDWQPTIVLAAGPPLYLSRLSKVQCDRAWKNAVRLAQSIDVVILDHHLMRGVGGAVWLDRLSATVAKQVYCAGDFMGRPRRLLEANRAELYEQMPEPNGWHEDYERGQGEIDEYFDMVPQRNTQL